MLFFDPDDKVENNLYAELIHAIEDKKNRFGFMWLFYIPHSSDTHTKFQTIPMPCNLWTLFKRIQE